MVVRWVVGKASGWREFLLNFFDFVVIDYVTSKKRSKNEAEKVTRRKDTTRNEKQKRTLRTGIQGEKSN